MATTGSTSSTKTTKATPTTKAVAKVIIKASVPTSNCTVLPVYPEVITYCLGETMVYVKPAKEYEEAIEIAIQEFPVLKSMVSKKTESDWKDHIKFYTTSSVNGKLHNICISRSAWKICTQRMLRGEVITIRVVDPEEVAAEALKIARSEAIGSPPEYLEIPKHSKKEKAESSVLRKSMSWISHRR